MLGVEPAAVVVDQVGLNHLTWVRAVRVDGDDVLPEPPRRARRNARRRGRPCRVGCSRSWARCRPTTCATSTRTTACSPSSSTEKPRAATGCAEIERGLLELYRDPTLNEKPALLEQRGGAFYSEAATGLVASSLAAGDGETCTSSTSATRHARRARRRRRRRGAGAGRARRGAVPLAQAPLAPELLGLAQHVAAYERLTAEAAVTRDLETARKALLAHPLIGQWGLSVGLLERLIAAGYLPTLVETAA